MAWTAADIPDQHGRLAVITGANSGLGFEASRELARAGAAVVLAVRDPERGERAAGRIRAEARDAVLEVRPLDLGSLASVRTFAAAVVADHPVVDLLINNAGVMATPPGQTVDGFETQVGVDHLGHYLLTMGLMPALERATAARVVTLTSIARLQGRTLSERQITLADDYDAWRAYGDAKLANYQFGIELARRLSAAGSTVSSLVADPGLAGTNLQAATVHNAGAGLRGRMWHLLARTVGMPPARGVLPVLRAATDSEAQNGETYGPRWRLRGEPVRFGPERKRSAAADTRRMWAVSEAATAGTSRLDDRE